MKKQKPGELKICSHCLFKDYAKKTTPPQFKKYELARKLRQLRYMIKSTDEFMEKEFPSEAKKER